MAAAMAAEKADVPQTQAVSAVQSLPTPAVAPAPVQPAVTPPPQPDPVSGRVLAVVAEKTGYPQDMLDLDLDLEADLGIDTVKQAETFAAIRESFDIAFQEGINLRDYPTLASVIGFVHSMRPDLAVATPAPVVPSAPAAAQPAQASTPQTEGDPVTGRVLAVVAEKTGYPQDMLDLDLDLEADLGIDTVKQAETFAAIRETFAIPLQEGLNLRDYPTLAAVIGFVRTNRPDLAAPASAASEPTPAPVPAVSAAQGAASTTAPDPVVDRVLAVVAEKTGYPRDMLDLDLDLEADLGVDTVKQAETFAAIRESFKIPLQEGLNLRDYPTLASVIGFVHTMRPDLASVAPVAPQAAPHTDLCTSRPTVGTR